MTGWEELSLANSIQRRAGVAIPVLISDKIDFKSKVTRNKE